MSDSISFNMDTERCQYCNLKVYDQRTYCSEECESKDITKTLHRLEENYTEVVLYRAIVLAVYKGKKASEGLNKGKISDLKLIKEYRNDFREKFLVEGGL